MKQWRKWTILRAGIFGLGASALQGCSAQDTSATTAPKVGAPDAGGGTSAHGGGGGNPSGGGGSGGSAASSGAAAPNAGASGSISSAGSGGISSTGGSSTVSENTCPYAEPAWAPPSIPSAAVCDGVSPPPAVGKWLDDFEGTTFDASLTSWNVAADTANGECVVTLPASAANVSLLAWGSHDGSSQSGLHLQAYMGCFAPAGSNNWGAQWQLQTEPKQSGRAMLDLSAYTGLVIWARQAGSPGKGNMSVAFMTPQTTPGELGGDGTCGTDPSGALCFGYYQAPAKVLAQCWAPIVVKFADLQPLGPAPASGFDQAHVFGIQLAITAWDTAAKSNFPADVLIDDLYLF